MNEGLDKKILVECRKNGAVVLKHQFLKIHQNGAKFTINKAYVDDELLEVDTPYTLILIPENLSQIYFVLSHFHPKRGPSVFNVFPTEQLSAKDQYSVAIIMDQIESPEDIKIEQVNNFYTVNKLFEVPSEIPAANKESIMISALFPIQPHQEQVEKLKESFDLFIKEFKKIEHSFIAFYQVNEYPEKSAVLKNNEEVQLKIIDLIKKLSEWNQGYNL